MHVHLPKPLHGWRAFVGEVGIIVLGVLIALSAEQIVASARERAELGEIERGMQSELRDDDLPQAFTRAAVFNCYADQLDAIEKAVRSGDRGKLESLANSYKPIVRTWDDEAWKAAQASPVLVKSGAKRMLAWSLPYASIPLLSDMAKQEWATIPQLRAPLSGSGPLSPEQQDRVFQIVASLRHFNDAMTGTSMVFIIALKERGMTLSPAERQSILADARHELGSCVTEPAPEHLRLGTQITRGGEAQLGRR